MVVVSQKLSKSVSYPPSLMNPGPVVCESVTLLPTAASLVKFVCLCSTPLQQTAPPFTDPCKGHEGR